MGGTPVSWRLGLGLIIAALAGTAWFAPDAVGAKGRSAMGVVAFISLAALFSSNLRAVRFKTIFWGIALQFALATAILHWDSFRYVFVQMGEGIKALIKCSDAGAYFVFGSLTKVDGPSGFVFAFLALPPIIFISAFFSVLYYLGVLQLLVRFFAWIMRYFMGTSGAETLSVSANVFMGQTEAPLIVKPFIPKMTQSELLALMASGMAHISGGMMAVYMSYGVDPVSILCTCVMACPGSLYLAKLVLPETEIPETATSAPVHVKSTSANVIDAASTGVRDGLYLALNVAAMLIGFLAFIAFFDLLIANIKPLLLDIFQMRIGRLLGLSGIKLDWWQDNLGLRDIFGVLFAPVALLLGVEPSESFKVGRLLGTKLVANEHVAYIDFTKNPLYSDISDRSKLLVVYALSGFANFASIGIQLGGIGAMAENRRGDLARLGMRALFVGYLATLVNASIAGLLMS